MGGAHHGLGVPMAIIFLAGEMAGSGILALPNAMIGTGISSFWLTQTLLSMCGSSSPACWPGWWGVAMIFLFMVNACFCGTRLGICWTILEERYEEFRHPMRNPYPAIGEKALGKFGKWVSQETKIPLFYVPLAPNFVCPMVSRVCTTLCVCITLYGTSCVFIALISQMLGSFLSATVGFDLSICKWMVIVAAVMLPLTWFGTPKDFWWDVCKNSLYKIHPLNVVDLDHSWFQVCGSWGFIDHFDSCIPHCSAGSHGPQISFKASKLSPAHYRRFLQGLLLHHVCLCWSLNFPHHPIWHEGQEKVSYRCGLRLHKYGSCRVSLLTSLVSSPKKMFALIFSSIQLVHACGYQWLLGLRVWYTV